MSHEANFKKAFSSFDFERVDRHMRLTSWDWANGRPVKISEMRKTVKDLFEGALKGYLDSPETDGYICATGGFRVECGSFGYVRISFDVTDSYFYDNEESIPRRQSPQEDLQL